MRLVHIHRGSRLHAYIQVQVCTYGILYYIGVYEYAAGAGEANGCIVVSARAFRNVFEYIICTRHIPKCACA